MNKPLHSWLASISAENAINISRCCPDTLLLAWPNVYFWDNDASGFVYYNRHKISTYKHFSVCAHKKHFRQTTFPIRNNLSYFLTRLMIPVEELQTCM